MECGFNIEMFPFADNKLAYTTMTVLHTILNNNKLFFCNPLSVENQKKLNNKQTKNKKKNQKTATKTKQNENQFLSCSKFQKRARFSPKESNSRILYQWLFA